MRVTNTGTRAGGDVVQLYSHQRTSRDQQPIQRLQAFQRVHLAAGGSTVVHFALPASKLAHWDVTRSKWVVERSTYDLLVGESATAIRQSAAVNVRGEIIPARDLSRTTQAQNFDDYSGTTLVDESKTGGTAVGATAAGQWVKYADAQLRVPRAFTARVANSSGAASTVEVRLDSPTGRLLGTADVPATTDKYTYTSVSAPLAHVGGRHSVYLVLGNDVRLASFSLS
ncbi:carbohydrate-binding protein [Nocardioides sp. CER19]|uniref:carbohydrate-binding protein n=1 Tax=Nocardioides sp. CER19 TaxID=3038538 RepID=UPI0024479023|nr:carbohydrate-binding protein [Nocardioides sp. CER19]MDH2416230.1 carbohydrate-binding protein [Nocardioides sp. CER19]